MLDVLKYIYSRAKGATQNISLIFLGLLIGYIAAKMLSCGKVEPQAVVQPSRDTIATAADLPEPIKEAIKAQKPEQGLIGKIFTPIKEAIKTSDVIIKVQRDTVFNPKFLSPSRELVYNLQTVDDQIAVYSINPETNSFRQTDFKAPDWWRDFTLVTSESDVRIYFESRRFLEWERINLMVDFTAFPDQRGKAYLWTGLKWLNAFSTQIYLSSFGEIGFRTNVRL